MLTARDHTTALAVGAWPKRRPAGLAQRLCPLILVAVVSACSASPPANIDDSCAIFAHKHSWYRASKRSQQRWGTPIPVQLAIIHQESRFRARARPPRRRILWIIPGPRPSSAYGYTQALSTTWNEYIASSGNRGADRNDFADAVDFIGWYTARTAHNTGVSQNDAYSLYLAYHEGDGGFLRKTYRKKKWLLAAARKVQAKATRYRRQLSSCEGRFKRRWWLLWLL